MTFSIIIPVYNAEGSLRRSLESLLAQAFRDFEIVFVDDCSTDTSPAIIRAFLEESGIAGRVVTQERNGGVASARSRGLREAKGDYLVFLDADDMLSSGALDVLAESTLSRPDIIGWDWTLGFEKNARLMRQARCETPLDALRSLMGGTMRWNLWLFSLRREFVISGGLDFLPGANMGEDMQFMLKAFCRAGNFVQLHRPLYCYNAVSATSLSRQFTPERRREIETNLREAETAVLASSYSAALEGYLNQLKLFLKLPLLMGTDRSLYELWYHWFPESNAAALSNKALPLRTRLVQWAASKRQWWAVKAYYCLVYRFVYGILYR